MLRSLVLTLCLAAAGVDAPVEPAADALLAAGRLGEAAAAIG